MKWGSNTLYFPFNPPKTDFIKCFGFFSCSKWIFLHTKVRRNFLSLASLPHHLLSFHNSVHFSLFLLFSLIEEDRSHFISPNQVTHICYLSYTHTQTHTKTMDTVPIWKSVREFESGVRTSTFNGITDVCFISGHHRTSYSPPLALKDLI